MIRRVLAALEPPAALVRIPAIPLNLLVAAAKRLGGLSDSSAAMLLRLQQDLVFDASAARTDFGYAPRPFRPEAAMFCPPDGAMVQRTTKNEF
jgi:hypothetical protein